MYNEDVVFSTFYKTENKKLLIRYESFSAVITEIYRHLFKLSSEEMKKYGLHGSSARLLLILLKRGSITAAAIVKESGRNKAEVSRTIADLEGKGLVIKVESPKNYRVKITLTEKGRTTAQNITDTVRRAVGFTSGSIPEEEIDILYKSLNTIASNLAEMSRSGIPESEKGEKL